MGGHIVTLVTHFLFGPFTGVISPFITSRDPPCIDQVVSFFVWCIPPTCVSWTPRVTAPKIARLLVNGQDASFGTWSVTMTCLDKNR